MRYGLALGSGGARGFAHIGVIRGLERLGIRPVAVAGASIGALIGALYALGASAEELAHLRLGARVRAAIRPRLTRAGLLDPAPLIDLVHELLGGKEFADAAIPLRVTAVDLERDARVILDAGAIAPAVAASMMVPAVFPPLRVGDTWLSDPGILESVPVDAAALGVDTVIAVSADRARAPGDRIARFPGLISRALLGAGSCCEVIGSRAAWPWARRFGRTLACVTREKRQAAGPTKIVWIQPDFRYLNANLFRASERAILLGEEALRRATPLLVSPFAPQVALSNAAHRA